MIADVSFVKECIEKYRAKLLDTSRRNSLISFNHSEISRQHIRVIDELPDFLYEKLLDGATFEFLSLPGEDQTPPDEKTPEFMRHLEQAKLTDESYIEAIDSIDEDEGEDEDEESALDKIKKIERELRNKIREKLKLPVWKEQKILSNIEVAKKYGLNPSYEMPKPRPENPECAERHTDNLIQTRLKQEEMDRKLSGLNSYVRTDIEESGVNTLYAAFGFLEWYESASSDQKCISPLLLLQIEIDKKQFHRGYTYRIGETGEEPEINLCLSERLRQDFGIELPELTGEDKPETYLRKVNELIQEAKVPKKEKWKIRRFITIGRFRFARLVMFHDLNSKNWPGKTDISTNKIVQSLFAGSRNESSGEYAKDYDIDTPEVEEVVPLLITSADASQHSALVDVMKGNNIAIKGPPGTGKPQTITNIIANALAADKSVLFLAEKMAALNVVYKRLTDAGLGPYCLELHSTKTKRAEVIKSIAGRLELRSAHANGDDLASKIKEFKRSRDHITEYVNALNANFGRQNKPIYDYLWGTQRRKDRISNLLSIISQCKLPFEQADLSASELSGHTDALKTIAKLKKQVDAESDSGKHPWSFVNNADLNPFQQDELKLLIQEWRDGLVKIQSDLEAFNRVCDLSIGKTTQNINKFYNDFSVLMDYDISTLNQDFIANLANKEKASALVNYVERIRVYRSASNKIRSIHNVAEAINNLKNIEADITTAKKIRAEKMTALDIREHINDLCEELALWIEHLETLRKIGRRFGLSQKEDLNNIYALAEVPGYIASVPRDYLLFRTNDIIDETNVPRLKAAADTQEHIQTSLEDLEQRYDLSMMGKPHEIRMHAAALSNAGFFAIFDSSYRQAKKVVKLASRQKARFHPERSADILRTIADNQERKEKIEQDNQLQTICGRLFNGIQTDFRKLQQINEWAANIRKRYASGNQFSRSIGQWLLTGDVGELESVRDLASDDRFVALKRKIAGIKDSTTRNTLVIEYLANLEGKVKNLNTLENQLLNTASGGAVTFAHVAEDLPNLQNAKKARDAIGQDGVVKNFFGQAYKGADTDIDDIDTTAHFLGRCLAIPELKNGFDRFLNKDFSKIWKDFKDQLEAVNNTVNDAASISAKVDGHANICFSSPSDGNNWLAIDLSDLVNRLSHAVSKPNALNQWVNLNGHYAKSADTIKGPLLQLYDQKQFDFDTLPSAFEYMVYSAITREIYQRNPVISKTSGIELEQARDKIKALDREIPELQQQELCHKLNAARPVTGNGSGTKEKLTEGALLSHETTKKQRHIPIRKLMKHAGQSIQNIKPCFLMSPLTVAQYLEPGQFKFDLIVIDEASQMRPEDALGGIARADQIVVVGDPEQLPPTQFFQSTGNDDDEVEEDFDAKAIMDMALSAFRPSRILSRHYRSQHESLIAFSNYHFYDQSLILFPSPIKNPDELGVRLENVGGTYVGRANMDEVEAVVKAALDFMRKHPDRSLGIATMNQVQKSD
jgi:hypothetical protein